MGKQVRHDYGFVITDRKIFRFIQSVRESNDKPTYLKDGETPYEVEITNRDF